MSPDLEAGGEAEAWEGLLVRWEDEEAHRAYLARFPDLEGLARAGVRYREVLLARPSDPVALRWRDEVVRRATVQGLAQIPRTSPPRQLGIGARRAILAALLLGAALAVSWILRAFMGMGARS